MLSVQSRLEYFSSWIRTVIVFAVLVSTSGCLLGDEISALQAGGDENTIWVFAQFNVPEEGESIDSYWYYGRVSEALYNKIVNNNVATGFIEMKDVHYWTTDDEIKYYADEDENSDGVVVFRIENLVKIELIKGPMENDVDGGAAESEIESAVQDVEV